MHEPFVPAAHSTPDFELLQAVRVGADRLRAVLLDLQAMAPLHPLIESIEEQAPIPSLPGARVYRVADRIPFGPVRLKTHYVAAIAEEGAQDVTGYAWQSPGVRLCTRYGIQAEGAASRVRERCFVDAPFGLRRFVVSQARPAHASMLEGLARMLEAADAQRRP